MYSPTTVTACGLLAAEAVDLMVATHVYEPLSEVEGVANVWVALVELTSEVESRKNSYVMVPVVVLSVAHANANCVLLS